MQLALGGVLELDVKMEDLPANSTLHAVKLCLGQETTPAKDESSSDELRPVVDEYALLIRGETGNPISGRARPRPEQYLWRGSDALALDDLPPGQSVIAPQTTHVHARASLPSPIISAVPTYDLTSTGIATVSHLLRLTFYYSVLGQGLHGEPLPLKDGLVQEGAIRYWSFEKDLIVASDTSISGQQGPPGYAACSCSIGLEPNDALPLFPSVAIGRTTAIVYNGNKWPSLVPMNHKVLREMTTEHFEETEGLCECFADRAEFKRDAGAQVERATEEFRMIAVKV